MAHFEPDDELLTLRQAAKLLNVSMPTIRKWVEAGTLEAVRLPTVGKHLHVYYRIRRRTLDELIIEEE